MNWLQKISQISLIPVNDEFDEESQNLADQAWKMARDSSISILSDKDVTLVAVDSAGVVCGALFTSIVGDVYSFDVIVRPEYQRQGIGRQLTLEGVREYYNLDMPDLKMELDVVNPYMQRTLMDQGLQIERRIGNDRVIMTKSTLASFISAEK